MNIKSIIISFMVASSVYSMGLRSFVALPVDDGGGVVRLQYLHAKKADSDTLIASLAYGIDAKQTLLLGTPYFLKPNNKGGDISVLYRYTAIQNDFKEGSSRLGLLGGMLLPTKSNSDSSIQAGAVYTYFINRHEIDIDGLFQKGLNNRLDSAKYDISWQYRLLPSQRDDWGISSELYSVIELNGRYLEGHKTSYQNTIGLQWVHPRWVVEGAYIKDLNTNKEESYLLSIRIHF